LRYGVDQPHFEWDPAKNESNKATHGVSFEEAIDVFRDEHALLLDDPDHSDDEDRFLMVGKSILGVLVVSYCFRNNGIRIISARKANRRERDTYVRGLN